MLRPEHSMLNKRFINRRIVVSSGATTQPDSPDPTPGCSAGIPVREAVFNSNTKNGDGRAVWD